LMMSASTKTQVSPTTRVSRRTKSRMVSLLKLGTKQTSAEGRFYQMSEVSLEVSQCTKNHNNIGTELRIVVDIPIGSGLLDIDVGQVGDSVLA
jgi:hypothetical protein